MTCFRENRIIRREYIPGSEGYLNVFFRKAGTAVEQRNGDCGYTEGEDCIVIQWEGTPTYDSGYSEGKYPATMKGLKNAHHYTDIYTRR